MAMMNHALRQAEHLLLIPQPYLPRTGLEDAATKARAEVL